MHILGNTSTEYFNSVEVWSRWHVGKRIQLFAFVPFNHFRQVEMGAAVKASGIGDITLAGYYTLYNDAANKDKIFKQTLQAGGGVKLPTGKFIASSGSQQLNPSINTGSGSVDFLVNTLYSCRYKRLGVSAEANVRLNSENNDYFQYGHRFTGSARVFYWKDLGKKISILPNAGLMVETAAKDAHYQQKQQFSGGRITSFISGIDVYMGKWNWSTSYHLPL
ncbi:MAG: transporter, partial [Ferruginibacter sp.]